MWDSNNSSLKDYRRGVWIWMGGGRRALSGLKEGRTEGRKEGRKGGKEGGRENGRLLHGREMERIPNYLAVSKVERGWHCIMLLINVEDLAVYWHFQTQSFGYYDSRL
jgi:hypothetical protein